MKRKRMALLLAMALVVTSVNDMTMTVSATDLDSESVVELDGQEAEETEVTENSEVEEVREGAENVEIEFSDGDAAEIEEEKTDSLEIVKEAESENPELTSISEDADIISDSETSVVPDDDSITKIEMNIFYGVDSDNYEWFSFTPEEDGIYSFYSISDYDMEVYFLDNREYSGDIKKCQDKIHPDNNGINYYGGEFWQPRNLMKGKNYYYCVRAQSANITLQKLKKIVPDREITKLDEDYIYTVDITESGDHKWFSFTPEEDGKYKFYSTGDFDTFGYFFDSKDYFGELWEYSGDDFHYNYEGQGMENNFEFIKDLQAGKTYYYCVGLNNSTSGSFDVIFRKVREVKSIHATLNRSKIEAGMENGLSATLQYTFADGSIKKAELNANDYGVSDRDVLDEGTTDIKIIDSEGNENAYGNVLTKGKYKVIFSVGNVQSEALEFEAADIEDAGLYYGELKEGENPGTRVPANGRSFYKFIPSETQRYVFENCGRLWIYHKNKDGSLEETGDGYWNRPLLQKKETYYFRLMDIEEVNLKIYREPSLTSILFTPYSTEVYEAVVCDDNIGFYDNQIRGDITFTYDNKEPEEIKNIDLLHGWENHYLNKIETVIKDENGQTVLADNGLPAGKYEVYLKCKDIESTPYTLTVIPFEYGTLPLLKAGTNKVITKKWYAFSPTVTENYDISMDSDKCSVNWYYLDENGQIQSCHVEDSREMELDREKRYLVYFSLHVETSDNYAEKFNYTISRSGDCRWKETGNRAATCTENGEIRETCSVHGETRRKAIPKLGHKLGSRQTTKAATCAAAGESARICSRCKGKFEKQTIKATGKHKYGAWKTTKAATALSEGLRERTCTVCKKAKQTQKIATLKATLVLSVAAKRDLPLKVNRSYKVNVQMTKGDSVLYWKSSNPGAVTVDKYGKITGKQAGKSAKIAVKLRSGLSTWFNVKVQRTDVATTAIRLKNASSGQYMPGSVTLKRNQNLKVTPVLVPATSTQAVTYTTSNKKVATVASNGQIVARTRGTAYITAKSGSKYVRIKIVVNK